MAILSWPTKDPNEHLDFSIDWANRLVSGDTIATSSWDIPSGLTSNLNTSTVSTTTVWLSGGVAGTRYAVKNTIVTAGGRTHEQTVYLKIKDN